MARHQVRRLPVVENGRLVGIVAQADIALSENEKKTGELVEAISEPSEESAGSVARTARSDRSRDAIEAPDRHARVGAQNAFAADFHSRRRCAMSWARSSSLPPSSTWRSEGSARR